MASLRELRRKIKSIKSTQQITKAMKMVAAARMRRAQAGILAARPFAVKMEATVQQLAALEVASDIAAGRAIEIHPFFTPREAGKAGLLLITSDKGLCGGFNANLLRASAEWLRREPFDSAQGRQGPLIFVVGRKGREFIKRLKTVPLTVESELAGIFPKVTFVHAEMVGKAVAEAFLNKGLSRVDVVYNEFKSVAVQRVVTRTLLPMAAPAEVAEKAKDARRSEEYEFLPERQELLAALLPRFLKAQIYRMLLESQAAELAARMNAMDSASKNAGELIGAFSLKLNRQRQAIITGEIAELVSGAEALAQ